MPERFRFIADDDPAASRPARTRHAIAGAASIVAHALAVLAIVFLAPRVERPHTRWILASLIDIGDNGGAHPRGNRGGIEAPPAAGPTISATPSAEKKSLRVPPLRMAPASAGVHPAYPHRLKPAPPGRSDDHPTAASLPPDGLSHLGSETDGAENASGAGAGGSGTDSNRGNALGKIGGRGAGSEGSGTGAGDSSAHAEYGRNPPPPYPSIARRRAQQGTVTLRVLIGAEGEVKQVEVVQSSGVDSLDDSACETVRTRWRFVPARRDGIAVESWVVVPIRFTLTDVSKN